MSTHLKKLSIVGVSVVAALLVFFLNKAYFIYYFKAFITAGYDTNGHVQIGKYYAENIFPSVWGFAPKWLAGMPFPQFYPPLFYIILAIVYKIVPFIQYETLFKIFVIALTLSVPGLLALVASRFVKNNLSIWIAGLGGVFLLSTSFSSYDNLGVSLVSTFMVGLVTHLLGFVLLLVWMWMMFGNKESQTLRYVSSILLALIALSSIHVVAVAVIIFFVDFFIREREFLKHPYLYFSSDQNRRELLKFYILPGFLSVLLTAFWLLPMLSVYKFMPEQSLGVDGVGASNLWVILRRWWLPMEFSVLAIVALWWRKNYFALTIFISSLLVLVPCALNLQRLIFSLPIHIYRLLPFFYFSGALIAAFVFDTLISWVPNKKAIHTLAITTLALFALFWFSSNTGLTYRGFYGSYKKEKAETIAYYMSRKTGMYTVEVSDVGRQLNYLIADKAGPGLRSSYIVFAESSPNSFFYIPFRGELSANPETLSFRSTLIHNKQFLSKDPKTIVSRARKLGITYFLARSDAMKKVFGASEDFVLEKDFGVWTLYKLVGSPPAFAEVPKYEPVAVFSPLGIKGKKVMSEITYIFLQEQALIKNLDITMVWSGDENLDMTNLERFKTVLISSYKYTSFDKALSMLLGYAQEGKLVLVSSPDPLYVALKEKLSSNRHVFFVDREIFSSDHYASLPVSATRYTLDILDGQKQPINFNSSVSVKNNTSSIVVSLDDPAPSEVPVVIKSTYFPAWKQTNGKPVFMATPVFTLIYTKDKTEIIFTQPPIVRAGYLVSLITLGVLVGLVWYTKLNKKVGNKI